MQQKKDARDVDKAVHSEMMCITRACALKRMLLLQRRLAGSQGDANVACCLRVSTNCTVNLWSSYLRVSC